MKTSIIHSIVVCLAAFALPFMVACSSREESLPEEISEAILHLKVEPIGRTRAGTTAELPDKEKMRSVRIIVLHNDGKVEHNRNFSLENALAEKTILLKVTPNEKKKIFLFANEKSVSSVEGVTVEGENKTLTAFFNSYTEGMSGFEDEVDKLYFTPDYTKPIPMSSMYEIDFKEGREDYKFYLVRVATKFTVNFFNWRGEEVTVENFSIESHADKNFLMAHVNSYPDTQNPETNQKYPTWIDWLKAVSDASNVDSDAATNRFGWLTDYELPEQSTAKVYTHEGLKIGKPTVDIDYPDNSKPGVASDVPVFYLPESKNLKEGATEQEYILTIKIAGRAEPFVCKLDKLKALFRNTHLVVNITMYNSNEIVVDVIPYSEVNLEPEFGL